MTEKKKESIWTTIEKKLEDCGVGIENLCSTGEEAQVRIIGIGAGLKQGLDELGRHTRDQVVMVRVDEETSAKLDAWVETESVKSRSEAAALFIREGLKVRESELQQVKEALAEVKAAKDRLRQRAREIFGEKTDQPGETS